MKLNFNVRSESPAQPELNLSIDIPDKYAKIGLESIKLATAIREAIEKIKETLNANKDIS